MRYRGLGRPSTQAAATCPCPAREYEVMPVSLRLTWMPAREYEVMPVSLRLTWMPAREYEVMRV